MSVSVRAAPLSGIGAAALAYRPDIDGLRALAVMAVVLYHLGARGCFGGFVGVDVFFVISGYLITGLITHDAAFSIGEFYRRRLLRIVPALFVVLVISGAVAAYALLPSELVAFARSTLATTLFFSNVQYAHADGYFAPAAQSNALLHTWSLAVEEQFYLFWPLLLWRAQTRALTYAATIAVASFVAAAIALRVDPTGTFYFIHTRAWELMAGALIALQPLPLLQHRALREFAAAVGLALIAVAIKYYNPQVPFPGPAALLPVGGASLVIAAGANGPTAVGRLLALRPAVMLGKISYSLYLWHWPVIFFSQTALFLEQTPLVRALEFAVALLLAVASWRYVETPLRQGALELPARLVWRTAAIGACAIAAGATAMLWTGGFPQRLSPEENRIASFASYAGDRLYRGGQCFVVDARHDRFDERVCLTARPNVPTVLIVGDSHAAQLYPGFAIDPKIAVLQATATGCRPLLQLPSPQEPYCRTLLRQVLQRWLPAHPVDVLILAGRWSEADLPDLPQTLARLRPYVSRLVVVGPVPQYVSSLPRLLVTALRSHDPSRIERGRRTAELSLDARLSSAATAAGAEYFSMLQALCPQRQCRTLAATDVPMQFDYGHFTREGSEVAVALLRQWLRIDAAAPTLMAGTPRGPRA